jgi:predicted nucleotidyltransferase
MPMIHITTLSDGLSPDQRRAIQSVLARYPQVTAAVLYGSRAMGRQRPGSDIDLTLQGEIDLFTLNEISNALDDLLLPFTIDLSAWNDIDNQELKDHIRRVGKTFWSPAHSATLPHSS